MQVFAGVDACTTRQSSVEWEHPKSTFETVRRTSIASSPDLSEAIYQRTECSRIQVLALVIHRATFPISGFG